MNVDTKALISELKSIVELLQSNRLSLLEKDIIKDKLRSIYSSVDELSFIKAPASAIHTGDAKTLSALTTEDSVSKKQAANNVENIPSILSKDKISTNLTEPDKEDQSIDDTTNNKEHEVLIKKVAQSTQKLLRQEEPIEEKNNIISHDTIKQSVKTSEGHSSTEPQVQTPIKSLIDMNKKFFFVSELFLGDVNAYDSFLSRVDSTSSIQNALNLLQIYKREKPAWNQKDHAMEILQKVLEKKFGISQNDD